MFILILLLLTLVPQAITVGESVLRIILPNLMVLKRYKYTSGFP